MLEEGLEPSRGLRPFGFSYYDSFRCPFRFVAWTFSWPWLSTVGPSRQVSTPSSFSLFAGQSSWPAGQKKTYFRKRSLARDCHHQNVLRFPRIRLDSRGRFPLPVLKLYKSDASADSATPASARARENHNRDKWTANRMVIQCDKRRRTNGDPDGIRTRVAALKGPCPRPLDDGATSPGGDASILEDTRRSVKFAPRA